jgi:hypothetical protein
MERGDGDEMKGETLGRRWPPSPPMPSKDWDARQEGRGTGRRRPPGKSITPRTKHIDAPLGGEEKRKAVLEN